MFQWIKKAKDQWLHGLRSSEPYYVFFGVLAAIGHTTFYFFWTKINIQGYENFSLRLIAIILCLGIASKDFWPQQLKNFLPYYWFIVVFYCMPFFFTFMLLMNNGNSVWGMNVMTALMFMVLITDWITSILTLILGVILAWVFYTHMVQVPKIPENVGSLILELFPLMIVAAFLVYRRDQIKEEAKRNLVHLAASIAHELRTPLRTILSYAEGVQNNLPAFVQAYDVAKDAQLNIPYVSPTHRKATESALTAIEAEIHSTFSLIDIVLMNVNENVIQREYVTCSIEKCIQSAVRRFPFDMDERPLVHVEQAGDFSFWGDEELMTHVLFNLMKNALYFIKAAQKGEIFISTKCEEDKNFLYFKDTGSGISREVLPHIFEKFFTRTTRGSGVGLAFCKLVMKSFEGDIQCDSEEEIYTQFTLSFPKILSLKVKQEQE